MTISATEVQFDEDTMWVGLSMGGLWRPIGVGPSADGGRLGGAGGVRDQCVWVALGGAG